MTSHRYGAPMGRYGYELEHIELERVIVIGAPPTAIDFDPSGRSLAEAYVDRVNRAASRLNDAFVAWLREKWTDVAPDLQKVPTADERAFTVDWPPWFARWQGARQRFLQPEWLFPPAPSAIWMETQQFELELEDLRKRFAGLTVGTTVKAPPPPPDGSYEVPGGVKQPGLLDGFGVGDALGTVGTILIIGGVAWLLSSVAGIAGR